MPDSITRIENGVFLGNQLTSITLPDSITHIGQSAFASNQLTSVTLPDSVTFIGVNAFNQNPLTSITIGANVTLNESIGYGVLGTDLSFNRAYVNAGSLAGIYTRPNAGSAIWTRQ